MFYAEINKNNIVNGVSCLSGEADQPNMIEIPEYDPSLMGKKWDGEKFVDSGIPPKPPAVDPLVEIKAKLDKLDADMTEIKAKLK